MFDSDHNNSGMPKNISLYYPVPGMCLYVGSPKILDLKNKKKVRRNKELGNLII